MTPEEIKDKVAILAGKLNEDYELLTGIIQRSEEYSGEALLILDSDFHPVAREVLRTLTERLEKLKSAHSETQAVNMLITGWATQL